VCLQANYFDKLRRYVNEFGKIVVIGVDNVQSRQMQTVRAALRGRAELLMGKNTMIRKCLREVRVLGCFDSSAVNSASSLSFRFASSLVLRVALALLPPSVHAVRCSAMDPNHPACPLRIALAADLWCT
jgi:hypothetical protein